MAEQETSNIHAQLRQLHKSLDPDAPRFMPRRARAKAILDHLSELGANGGQKKQAQKNDDRGTTSRSRTGQGNQRRQSSREVRGYTIGGKQPGTRRAPARSEPEPGERLIDQLWRALIGD